MIETILALAERADSASPCIKRAVALAKASGAEIHLFRAIYEPLLEGYMGHGQLYEPLRKKLREEAQAELNALATEIRGHGQRCVAEAVWSRDRHEAVATQVFMKGADLVVAETSDHGGFSQADWKLISTCPAPILVVRRPGDAPYRHVVAAVDPYHEHGKPPTLDKEIIANAELIVKLGGGELKVVHCFSTVATIVSSDLSGLPIAQAEEALEVARRRALEELVSQAGLPTDRATLLQGRPEKVLAALAESGEADLFVLGVAARGRITEFFIGSTAERVMRHTPTDVLVVKPEDFRVSVTLGPAS